MYEELVNDLRGMAKVYSFGELENTVEFQLASKAADAIEELSQLVSFYESAADVRPVVLCRDCLHYEMGVCLKIYDDGAANKDAWQERKPEDFCSYGEKREES